MTCKWFDASMSFYTVEYIFHFKIYILYTGIKMWYVYKHSNHIFDLTLNTLVNNRVAHIYLPQFLIVHAIVVTCH